MGVRVEDRGRVTIPGRVGHSTCCAPRVEAGYRGEVRDVIMPVGYDEFVILIYLEIEFPFSFLCRIWFSSTYSIG